MANEEEKGIIGKSFGFAKNIGKKAAAGVGNAGLWTFDKVGTGMIAGADMVGSAMFSAAGAVPAAAGFTAGVGKEMAGHVSNVFSNLVNNSFDFVPKQALAEGEKLTLANGKFKTTGLGKGLLVVGGTIAAARKSMEAFEESRMGTNTGEFVRATPSPQLNRTPSYSDDGGATGDLVFALNKLRRG